MSCLWSFKIQKSPMWRHELSSQDWSTYRFAIPNLEFKSWKVKPQILLGIHVMHVVEAWRNPS